MDTGTDTPPADWTTSMQPYGEGERTCAPRAGVNPLGQSDTITSTFGAPFLCGSESTTRPFRYFVSPNNHRPTLSTLNYPNSTCFQSAAVVLN